MSSPTSAAIQPDVISCPNKQTTILSGGDAPPNESLIAYLGARPVGGGSSRQDGTWRIPLQVNERPGIYDVEVKSRDTRALIGRFTCYVNVPMTATDTTPAAPGTAETPTALATAPAVATGTVSALPTARRTAIATATVSVTAATVATARATATVQTTTAVATLAATAATATISATTATTTTTAITATTTANTTGIQINDVVCRDPQYPADSEFIELRNYDAVKVTLTGWRISNVSRGNTSYTFPAYTMNAGPDVYVAVYSGIGTNKPDFGELWWGSTDQLWFIGDKAELRDNTGKLIDSYVVLASSCTY